MDVDGLSLQVSSVPHPRMDKSSIKPGRQYAIREHPSDELQRVKILDSVRPGKWRVECRRPSRRRENQAPPLGRNAARSDIPWPDYRVRIMR